VKRIVIASICLVTVAVALVSIYFTFLSPKPTLEIVKIERFDNYFITRVKNNMPEPSNGYIPNSMRIGVGTVIIYNTQNEVVFTHSGTVGYLEPQETGLVRTDLHLNDGYSVVVKGFRMDTGEEIFSNRVLAPTVTQTTTAGKMIKFDSAFIDATSDEVTVYVRNWGTEFVTIDKIHIDGIDRTSSATGLPANLNVEATSTITLNGTQAGLDFTSGNTYKVKVTGPGVSWEESVKAS